MRFSPTEIYKGKNIFFIGGTGFVGKVTLSMLLHNFPNVGKVYATVRARSQEESEARFWNNVIKSPTFDPLRERYGSYFEKYIAEKVVPVNGDVSETNLGFTDEEAERIAKDIDVVINSAGNVTFSPPLESALRTNVVGTQNVIAFTKRMERPCLVHVSTCFVAGQRSGAIWENEPVVGYFPRKEELPDVEFSVHKEIEDCAKLAERAREEARDAMMNAKFRELARERLKEEGRNADDLDAMGLAVARERKLWTRERLTEFGDERAKFWGWPNLYTYTKSLGEQLVAMEEGIVRTIVRPSIVESSNAYPFPGWNEGFTTTAPLIFITLKGHSLIPVNDKLILDITPVDLVAGTMLAATAQALAEDNPHLVFQSCTGDSNPNDMKRIVGLCALYKRKHFQEKETGLKIVNEITARMEARAVSQEYYDRMSAPMMNTIAKKANSFLDRVRPRWGGGRITQIVDDAKDALAEFERVTNETKEAFELFRPFMIENAYILRADNVRDVMGRVPDEEKHLVPWSPDKLDWYDYWMTRHFPGLKKWVFPTLEDEMKAKPKRVYTYKDLLELFEATTKQHATRVAMRIERDGRKEQYTYEDLRELATRAASFFAANDIKHGMRVMLISENMPEWGMTYFGIMRAGATCIPVDPANSTKEFVSFARAGQASGIVISNQVNEDRGDLREALQAAGLDHIKVWLFDEVFEMPDEETEKERVALLPKKVHAAHTASLIFTSGTTGTPKGVMLTHKNLTNMASMVSSVFDMDVNDGVLSVLPLHHTFEFSTGFIAPLSKGAQITYLEELSGEALNTAIKNGHVTGMVGVPALWELLHRRIKNRLNEKSDRIGDIADVLIKANSWLRDKTPFNFGTLIFYPIHQGMGGKIRYLISGGSALNEKIAKDFHGLGFTILEGYGLTEASPVLTVTRPGNKLISNSVGQALPGVEIKISDADANGIGEVIARGPNIMAGYFNNEEATRAVLIDRWLHTGDLGRLDDDGNLYIVGRSKEIIIDSNGKNIYPDEVEDYYSKSPYIKELSVVGLPDDEGGEKIACLVFPDYDFDITLSRKETIKKVEDHFRDVSSTLPFFKRVKVLHFTDDELPRTATKKVKRKEIVLMLQNIEDKNRASHKVKAETRTSSDKDWLIEIIAQVSNHSVDNISLDSRMSDLGFDSLMFVELASAIEGEGGTIISPDTLNEIQDVRELFTMVQRQGSQRKITDGTRTTTRAKDENEDEIYVPTFIKKIGNRGVSLFQKALYKNILHTSYEGLSNIPPHTNFIVAPNHCSHLDIGLVKMALGEYADNTIAIAAADYFFDNKFKRAYMDNFTNLIPIERSGSLRQSLRHAKAYLDKGHNAVIFPEGTRSMTGEMADFKPIIGYLAINSKIGILPVYIYGTYEAFPKGSTFLKSRDVGLRVGRYLEYEQLEKMSHGISRSDAYKLVAAFVRHEVENLRDRTRREFDAASLKRKYKEERRNNRKSEENENEMVAVGD
jgi:long-chain acyl-CoA synthetase